jgi:hypothetical protein
MTTIKELGRVPPFPSARLPRDASLGYPCVTPTFCKDKFFCANRSAYQIIVLVKNFPKINLA